MSNWPFVPQNQWGPPPPWAQPQSGWSTAAPLPPTFPQAQAPAGPLPATFAAWPQPWMQAANNQMNGDAWRSRKYPTLNPILAADTTLIRFDARYVPAQTILAQTLSQSGLQPVSPQPVTHLRLISKAFPWMIEIKASPGGYITCESVWRSLHEALQVRLEDSEWATLVNDKAHRASIEKAVAQRQKNGDKEKYLRRIDWLGDKTIFKGLEKDDDFEKARIMPGTEACQDTWVVKFGSSNERKPLFRRLSLKS